MGIISRDTHLIKLYYNSSTSEDKQTYSYAQSSEKDILGIDTANTKVPGSHWAEMADGLGIAVRDMVNTLHPNFTDVYGDEVVDFEDHDWLTILEKHPEVVVHPIAIVGERFYFIETPTAILDL